MQKEPETISLRFRYDKTSDNVQIAMSFPLDVIDSAAAERCAIMKEKGERYSGGAINYFARKLADFCSSTQNTDNFYSNNVLSNDVEVSIYELTIVVYAYSITFSSLSKSALSNAIIECLYDEKHGTTAHHISIPGNIFDEKILCPSVHMDSFLNTQRKIQSRTMNLLSEKLFIVDEIVGVFEHLSEFSKEMEENRVIVLFVMAVSQDFAPACSLILGGRLDAAYAIARRSIEILGASRIIANDKAAGTVWSNAHNNDKSWKLFKDLFKIKNMFPKGETTWDKVFWLYDALAREHHPNPNSFDRIKEVKRTSDSILMSVSSFSFDPETSDKSVGAFWLISYIFCIILLAFFDILFKHYIGNQHGELSKLAVRAAELTRKTWGEMRASDKKDYSNSVSETETTAAL